MDKKRVKTVSIVSLSSGILGESAVRHELELGIKRLENDFGLKVKFAENALKGLEYISAHPEKRASDLLEALRDDESDMLLCAIGGDDTYRLAPYLFENGALQSAVKDCGKIFLGFSDTTIDHFMLHKAGLNTFYGQSFLSDICEIGPEIPPYTASYFRELTETGTVREITPAPEWYESRTDFSSAKLGTPLTAHPDTGFELLQGGSRFSGAILGGCIDSIYDMFSPERYADMPEICARFGLFPDAEQWRGKILLLETSEEKMSPEKYEKALRLLKNAGVLKAVSGILAGKPMDGAYAEEYKKLLVSVTDDPALPIVFNINVGHASPRCIIPFGIYAEADAEGQRITFYPDRKA